MNLKQKAFIGIDPGSKGFITLFIDGDFKFFQMPTHKVDTDKEDKSGKFKQKEELHKEGFRDLIIEIKTACKGYDIYCAIEDVHGRNNWSAENTFNFGYVAGMQFMIACIIKAKIIMVRPQKWQSVMYNGFKKVMVKSSTGKTMVHDTKQTSKNVARELAPHVDFRKTLRSKNMDDNKTDSFLICCYLIKIFKKYGKTLHN